MKINSLSTYKDMLYKESWFNFIGEAVILLNPKGSQRWYKDRSKLRRNDEATFNTTINSLNIIIQSQFSLTVGVWVLHIISRGIIIILER